MTDLKDYFRVGVITSPHGVHGEVNVFPTTDEVERFNDLKEVLMVGPRDEQLLHITGVKYFKNMVILRFKEFSTMNEAELLRQRDLYVDRAHAIKLNEGEHFIADLIGCRIISDEDKDLGVLADVLQTGANDVYVIEMPDKKELLLPSIPECVLNIDIENKTIRVHVLKGLLEE